MTVITNIEDLRVLAKKRVPRMFYDYADCGSWTESTYRANETDFDKILLRQRVAVNIENRSTRSTMVGQPVAMPVALAPVGLTGMQHADGEILAARAAKKFGVPVHAFDDEHLLDRGRGRGHRQSPVLVPAVRDEGPDVHRKPDRPGQGGRVLGPGAHARPADHRPAAQGPEERPVRAAQAHAAQHPQHDDQAALGTGHAGHAAARLPQHRRPCEGRQGHGVAVGVDVASSSIRR